MIRKTPALDPGELTLARKLRTKLSPVKQTENRRKNSANRMRRMREALRTQWGSIKYDSAQALYEWVIYLLLGKLNSGFYLLEKTATIHPGV
jgi:hypothetical protein